MRKILTILLLLVATTSVYASDFQWSRLYHNRLNTFVRTTKLPQGQYVIGVYSTGNTITEYTEPVAVTNTVTVTKEVVKEVPVEKIVEVEKQLPAGTIVFTPDDIALYRSQCFSYRMGWDDTCVLRFLSSKGLR